MDTKERDKFVEAYEILWKIFKSGELNTTDEQKMLNILNLMDDEFPEVEL